MRSILTRLTKLKTYKKRVFRYISALLSFVFLLVSFFASSRSVYAFSDVPYEDNYNITFSAIGNPFYGNTEAEWSNGSWRHYGANSNITGANYYPGYGVRDFYIRRNLQLNTSVYSYNYSYKGYVRYQETFNIDDFCKNYSGVDNEYINYIGVSVETEKDYSYFDRSTSSYVSGDAGSQYWNNKSGVVNFSADTNVYLQGDNLVGSVTISLIYHFKIYYVTTLGFSTGPANINFNTSVNNSGLNLTSRFSRAYSDKYYLYNIANEVNGISTGIFTDNSGSSTNLNNRIDQYDTAESLASSSMAGALPDASSQLSSITSYDYGQLYSGNVSAFNFWKSLGDFVLSNSNLVGIGALLILILFAGLVVYLLRL